MKRRHWLLAATLLLLAGALIAIAKRFPNRREAASGFAIAIHNAAPDLGTGLQSFQRARLVNQRNDALRRLHALELRDSLVTGLARLTVPHQRVRSLVLGEIAAHEADRMLASWNEQWRALAVDSVRYPVLMVFSIDSLRGSRSGGYENWGWDVVFAPPRTSEEPCIAVVRAVEAPLPVPDGQTHTLGDPELYQSAGLCAFYAAFGTPGPGIREWLERREYDVAREANWQQQRIERETVRKVSLRRLHPMLSGSSYEQVNITSPEVRAAALRCSDGDTAACEQLVLDPALRLTAQQRTQRLPFRVAATDSMVWTLSEYSWSSVAIEQLLSAMARSLGTERFVRFWQSNDSPEAAFQATSGERLGVWVQRWLRGLIGDSQRGTHIPALSVLLALLFLAAGFAPAARAAARRSTD